SRPQPANRRLANARPRASAPGEEGANGNALEVRRSDPTSPATRALPGPRWRDGAQAATAAHAQQWWGAPRYRSAPVNSSIERRRRAGRHFPAAAGIAIGTNSGRSPGHPCRAYLLTVAFGAPIARYRSDLV